MFNFLKHVFTWWNGYTIGTKWYTIKHGVAVGSDGQGNVYYRSKKGDRRWVIYNGEVEASRIPAEWHAWLHRTSDKPPSEAPLPTKPWEKEHRPNRSGTAEAYFPGGSLDAAGRRPHATGDYEPWRPE